MDDFDDLDRMLKERYRNVLFSSTITPEVRAKYVYVAYTPMGYIGFKVFKGYTSLELLDPFDNNRHWRWWVEIGRNPFYGNAMMAIHSDHPRAIPVFEYFEKYVTT